MAFRVKSKLDSRKKYLQIALNSTLEEARRIISLLPVSDRIIVEAGTPLIKRYGEHGIRQIRNWYAMHVAGRQAKDAVQKMAAASPLTSFLMNALLTGATQQSMHEEQMGGPLLVEPYVVADLKTMDRGGTEVEMAARAGASAAVALGSAPKETLDYFIERCEQLGLDAMIDMMNVEYPLSVLRSLKKIPPVVIIHRGVDEEQFNKQKMIPLHEIRRIKGSYDIMISIAGGDTVREVQSAVFNDADIVVVWKSVYQATGETIELVNGFLKQVK